MNEPDISPLAKRLAEENNVRWQELTGTGAGGKVVERDVLEYLARVMSGEEAVDPTPEPLPEGLEAWPDEDVAGYQREVPSGQLSDLQAELSAADRVGDSPLLEMDDSSLLADEDDIAIPDMMLSDQFDETDQVGAEEITEDIFLFEDGDDQAGLEAEQSMPVSDLEDDDLLIAGDAEPMSEGSTEGHVEAQTEGLDLGEFDPFDTADESFDEMLIDEGERIQVIESDEELPDLFADDSDGMAAEAGSLEVEELEPVLAEEESEAFQVVIPEPETDEATASVPEPEIGNRSEEAEVVEFAQAEEVVGYAQAEEVVGYAQAEEEGVVDETTPGVVSTIERDLPLVRYGNLLRRHLDLTALAAAQLAVSREVALEEPVPPTAFLVRAAAKAMSEVALGEGGVAVARFDSGILLQELGNVAGMPFRELLEQIGAPDPELAEAEGLKLVVADMSSLDVDEAVLNLGVPVLTLGRILYDNQQGSYRSTLSLAGDLEPDQGAQFLSLVAEFLGSPVQLVL